MVTARHDAPPTEPGPPWVALPVVLMGLFLATLDFFIVPVALPSLQDDLRSSGSQLQLVVTVYGVVYACLLVTGGRLGDLYGYRRVFAISLVAFLVASAACGLAPTNAFLIVARAGQGAAAAALSPPALAMIGALFGGRHRVRALTAFSLTMGIAAVFGQLLGGILIDVAPGSSGWRWCFLINLPLGVLALSVTRRLVPATSTSSRGRLDWPGTALVALVLAALVVPLVEGREHGWPAWAWGGLASCPVLALALARYLVRAEQRDRATIVSPALFRYPGFATGLLVQGSVWGGQAALFFVLALYLQSGMGLGALGAGGMFSVLGAGYPAGSLLADRIARRRGPTVISVGAAVMATGLVGLLALSSVVGTGERPSLLVPGLLLEGVGMGLAVGPLTGVVLAHVSTTDAGAVSGILAAVAQAGTAIGVAAVGIAFYAVLHTGTPVEYVRAFERSLGLLALLELGVAALAYRLAKRS